MSALYLGLTALLSYLVGAIPFGYLVARARGVDIMKQGSGNIGATNVGRVLGRPFGILVFLLDFAKGAVPVLLAGLWAGGRETDSPPDTLPVMAAVAAFLGHLYPVYLHFRGGKGVATAAGAVTVLLPGPALAALSCWLAVVLASSYVSLASLAAAGVLCAVRLGVTPQPWAEDHLVVTVFCFLAAGLIFVRHRANVGRLLRGNENRLKEGPAMLHFSKILHVLSLGLWFGTVVFFSFVVGLNLFGTFEAVAARPGPAGAQPESEHRPRWFPVWDAYDGAPPDKAFPDPLRKEQGTLAAGVAISPLFKWYFGIQAVCALLATATAVGWLRAAPGRTTRVRALLLTAALGTVAIGWWLERVVDDLRVPRNESFAVMVSHTPPLAEDVRAAAEARATFVHWHLASLALNLLTVALVTVAMTQAAYLPAAPGEKQLGTK